MTEVGTLAITLPTLITIFGAILAWQNYKLKKRSLDKSETAEEVERKREEEEHRKEVESRLVAIEKDVQYIRLSIDKFDKHIEDHEKRITKIELSCKRHTKGGK